MKQFKTAVLKAASALAPEAIELSDAIWDCAEEPFKEFRSSALVRAALERRGFIIAKEFRAMPTAFVMNWGTGRPHIGVLAEYDALPDCGLKKGTWGHGCGHNLLGAGSTLAALIARRVMEQSRRLRGTISLLGCPAEETLAGKVYLARDGAFNGYDAILAWHPSAGNSVSRLGGSAMDSMAFEFFGRTAHGASAHMGRSALDAQELMDHAVNILREHIPENVRIHSILSVGGTAPNVVPEYARSWYYIRAKDRNEVDEITERVVKCARGAAKATETRVKTTLLAGIYNRLPNDAMVDHMQTCFKLIGPPRFTKKDKQTAKKLGLKPDFNTKIGEIGRTAGRASSDEDTVSWVAPLGRINVACSAKNVAGHHRDMTRQGKTLYAHKGMVQAGKVLALGALGLMADARLRGKVQREFKKRTKGFRFDPIVPKNQLPPIRDRIPPAPPQPE
ncbi:MAG: amidohydrolase [Planctomycetes bacterium]|nr:amidohydrolase [Planctomycetota bacterium]